MPNYNTQVPPYSIFPGDVALAFNSESPSAVNVALQTAMTDSDSQYSTIDSSTVTAGESRTVSGVRANFIRAKVSSITGGSGVTVQLLG